jgi:hypothetical protein
MKETTVPQVAGVEEVTTLTAQEAQTISCNKMVTLI